MKDDFTDFLAGDEPVPEALRSSTRGLILRNIDPKLTVLKYFGSNLLGAILTLTVCPQFGYGPLGGEFGFLHYIMSLGPVWCGVFCASLFFAGGNALSLIALREDEREWIASHKASVVLPWISLLFFLGMISKFYAPGFLHHDSSSYHLSWYGSALLISLFAAKIG